MWQQWTHWIKLCGFKNGSKVFLLIFIIYILFREKKKEEFFLFFKQSTILQWWLICLGSRGRPQDFLYLALIWWSFFCQEVVHNVLYIYVDKVGLKLKNNSFSNKMQNSKRVDFTWVNIGQSKINFYFLFNIFTFNDSIVWVDFHSNEIVGYSAIVQMTIFCGFQLTQLVKSLMVV